MNLLAAAAVWILRRSAPQTQVLSAMVSVTAACAAPEGRGFTAPIDTRPAQAHNHSGADANRPLPLADR